MHHGATARPKGPPQDEEDVVADAEVLVMNIHPAALAPRENEARLPSIARPAPLNAPKHEKVHPWRFPAPGYKHKL